jgi:translation initiation factor IF-3
VVRFLDEGNKVKLTIWLRGREIAHPELGMRILRRIADDVGDLAVIESQPRQDGRNMTMVLHPTKKDGRKPDGNKADGNKADRSRSDGRNAKDNGASGDDDGV